MIIIFRKFELKFIKEIPKTGAIKILITIPLTLETMQQLIIKPWRRSLRPWCRKNDKTIKKIQKT